MYIIPDKYNFNALDRNRNKAFLAYDDDTFIKAYNNLDGYKRICINDDIKKYNTIPLCVQCFKYIKNRSKFIDILSKNNVNRPVYVFTYNKNKDSIPKSDNYKIVVIRDELCYDVAVTRNFIKEYFKNEDDIFIVEDDVQTLKLLYGRKGRSKRNTEYIINESLNLTNRPWLFFNIWEFIIREHCLQASAIAPWNTARFANTEVPIKNGMNMAQMMHIKPKLVSSLIYRSDTFDDFDFSLQMMENGIIPQFVLLSFSALPMNDGKSSLGDHLNGISERQNKYVQNLLSLWGNKLVKTELKNNVINCRINSSFISKQLKKNYNIRDIIKQHKGCV